jgi:hypothetical protein
MICCFKKATTVLIFGFIFSFIAYPFSVSYGFKKGIRTKQSLRILNVSADKVVFNPAAGETVTIRFKLTQPARISCNICDGRDILIRNLVDGKSYPAGDGNAVWDGRDDSGSVVPPEAYVYILSAISGNASVISDLTDAIAGEIVRPKQVKLDTASGLVTYVLLKPARVRIRLGIKAGGPLLRTLVDWQPRPAGLQREIWDGFDTGQMMNFKNNPEVEVAVEAFALSSNTIIVKGTPETGSARFVQTMGGALTRRIKKAPLRAIKRSPHAAHPIEANREPRIELIFPSGGMQVSSQDTAIVIDRPTPIKLQIAPGEPGIQATEPVEIAYYLDFKFFEEVYVDSLPATWTFDPARVAEGEHILTGAFYDRQGHVGTTMVKIVVKHQK